MKGLIIYLSSWHLIIQKNLYAWDEQVLLVITVNTHSAKNAKYKILMIKNL